MHSTMKPKQTDDPHDVLVVGPDAIAVAPTDEELSRLANLFRQSSNSRTHAGSGLNAGPPVPPVDTTFRSAGFSDVQNLNFQIPNFQDPNFQDPNFQDPNFQIPGHRRSIGGRGARPLTAAVVFAGCTRGAPIALQSY